MSKRTTRSDRSTRKMKAGHRRYTLRGDQYVELRIRGEDGEIHKVRVTCPGNQEMTRVAIHHTPAFERSGPAHH
jgi:hypothetical protein